MNLSIIIVSYNAKDYLKKCLNSLISEISSRDAGVEIIVVDNASIDGSPSIVKQNFPQVKLIQNQKNSGFAKANNQATKQARGDYLLFLNSDTEIKPGSLSKLISLAQKNQALISSCQLLNADGTIQPQGGYLPRLTNLAAWMLFIDDIPIINTFIKRYQERRLNFFTIDRQLGWVSGTAMLVKRQTWNQLGGFDTNLFMYGEDVELCLRAKKSGMTIHFFHQPQIIHHGHRSGSSQRAILGEYQSLIYIFQKHQPAWKLPLLKLLLKTGAILRILLFGIIAADAQKRITYQKAFKLA